MPRHMAEVQVHARGHGLSLRYQDLKYPGYSDTLTSPYLGTWPKFKIPGNSDIQGKNYSDSLTQVHTQERDLSSRYQGFQISRKKITVIH